MGIKLNEEKQTGKYAMKASRAMEYITSPLQYSIIRQYTVIML
ncbi:MAG: hypothetical protein V8Q76_14245 [Bacteroides intestinalis]